jgi:hypothetical protein
MTISNIQQPVSGGQAVTKAYVDAISSGFNFRNIDEECLNGIGVNDGDAFYINSFMVVRFNGAWFQLTNGLPSNTNMEYVIYDKLTEEEKIGHINSPTLVSNDKGKGFYFFNEYVVKKDKGVYKKYKLLFK